MYRLRTLGTLELRDASGAESRPVLTQPRRLALLAYLAIAGPHRYLRRDTLLALFWEDQPIDRGRASLSRALYFLRHELGPRVVISRGDDEVALDQDHFWCDAAAFHTEVGTRRLRDGLALYGGDLLPGFFAPRASGFEEWLELERARLRDRASAAAWELALEDERAGNRAEACGWAKRSAELARFSESAVQRLLILLDRAGDRAGADHAYREFAGRLAADLDLVPSPETEALITAIRRRAQPVEGTPGLLREVVASPSPALEAPGSDTPVRTRRRARPVLVAAVALAAAGTVLASRTVRTPPDPDQVHVAPVILERADSALSGQAQLVADHLVGALTATGLVRIAAAPRKAGLIVQGMVYRENGRFRFEARIREGRTERIVWSVRSGPVAPDATGPALDTLSRRIAGGVAALSMPRFAIWFPTATSPPLVEAFLEFARADQLQARGADREAVPYLERAAALDPEFAWAELQLAAAHLALFDSYRADPIIERLQQLRDRLNSLQRHWLDWMRAVTAEDVPGAYEAINAAAALAPERFLFDVARWATFLNRPGETIALLERLAPGSPYNGGTAAYWRLLTRSYHALGDFEGELAAARRARLHPVASIVARSLEIIALAARGRIDELKSQLDSVLQFPADRGTSPRQLMAESGTSAGQVMVLAAEELRAHGHEAAAREMLARAFDWYADQPPDAAVERSRRFDLGMAAYYARDWSGADSIFRGLVAEDPENFVYLGRLGTIAARRGDVATARRLLERFESFRGTLPMPHTSVGYWQSKITVLLGDERRAMTLMREAIGPQGRGGMHADFDFERIWDTQLFRDFVRPKG